MATYDPIKEPIDPLQSPCVRNCCLDDQDVCLGCGRTLAEIRSWSNLSLDERKEVLAHAAQRKRAPPYISAPPHKA